MKRICLCLFLGSLFSSLFSEENVPAKLDPPKVAIQMAPYVYGHIFQPGYGVSIRTQISGHTFELAPMIIPPSGGHFGNSTKRMGLTCSYYYTFFRDRYAQPYLGLSYNHLRDVHRSTSWHYDGKNQNPIKIINPIDQENLFSSLIGFQFCSPKDGRPRRFPGYLFIDVQGPLIFDQFGVELCSFVIPRIGAGLQF